MSSNAPRGVCRPPDADGHVDRAGNSYTDGRRSSTSQDPMEPTCKGTIVIDTFDALIILQNCLNGKLNHVPRRPSDKERESMIASGNVFCYEETTSGIKRWTDGVHWSPSRILGNCLVYRELCEAFPPGEKKKANKSKTKRNTSTGGITRPGGGAGPRTPNQHIVGAAYNGQNNGNNNDITNDPDRKFIGSLLDSYSFKKDGLVKKTISFLHKGIFHHIVSYYTLEDARAEGRLNRPIMDVRLAVHIDSELWSNSFRTPLEQEMTMFDNRTQMHDYYIQQMPPGPLMAVLRNQSSISPQIPFNIDFTAHQLHIQQQRYYQEQQHLQNQYRPDQHHQPQQFPVHGLPVPQMMHAQGQAQVVFHREDPAVFQDVPLNDPSRQHQLPAGHYQLASAPTQYYQAPWTQPMGAYTTALPAEDEEFDENDVKRSIEGPPLHDPASW